MKFFLLPFSLLYGAIMWFRNIFYDVGILKQYSFGVPIISVGNISTGGTGKTPMTIAIANHYVKLGKKPAIVSRGYGRKGKGLLVVHNGQTLLATPETGGDEPVMIAQSLNEVPVIVCENRKIGIEKAIAQFTPAIIILDDAFQHRQVKRDIDIVLVNTSKADELKYVLPVGRLREPLNALKRANAIILTKGNAEQNSKTKKQIQGITPTPIYTAETNAEIGKYKNGKWVTETPKDTPFVFCGIADPDSFKSLLEKEHISTTHFRALADHHHYTERNVQALTEEIQKSQCSTILTTEKDIVKLPPSFLSQFKVYLLKYGLSCDLNEVLS